jgi:ribonuclease HII
VKEISKKTKYIVGIDEAGRGPVIGPLVICAYAIKKEDEFKLKKLGARDSKQLSKNQREKLYNSLKDFAVDFKTRHISPAEIDELRKTHSLNIIEQIIMIKTAKKLSIAPDEIYIDAADIKEKRFGEAFKVDFPNSLIVSKHQADKYYPVVSAASIIAKVQRDREIEKIAKEVGEDFGSGYPADPKTINFLRNLYKSKKKFPPFVRESWDTAKKIKKEFLDSKLTDYL